MQADAARSTERLAKPTPPPHVGGCPPGERRRSSSGAVSMTAWIWLPAWVRAFIAERRAIRSNRIAST
jgi:hypothetical protein